MSKVRGFDNTVQDADKSGLYVLTIPPRSTIINFVWSIPIMNTISWWEAPQLHISSLCLLPQDAAAAALFTACKVEDTLKKSREILCAAYNMKLTPAEQVSHDDAVRATQYTAHPQACAEKAQYRCLRCLLRTLSGWSA